MTGPMLLQLNEIQREDTHVERVFSAEDFEPQPDDFTVTGPVVLSIDVHVRDERVRVKGHVRAPLALVCGRCLEPYSLPVDADFDLEYVPETDDDDKPEREVEPAEFSLAYYRDEVIDLGALLTEQFYLAIPMKPLCQDTCGGLCAMCGKNLNLGSCDCRATWEDPRLAVLRSLLPKDEQTER